MSDQCPNPEISYVNSKQVTEIVLAILSKRGYREPLSEFAVITTILLGCGLLIAFIFAGHLDDADKRKNHAAKIGATRKQLISMRDFYKHKSLYVFDDIKNGCITEIMPHEKNQVHLWLLTVMENSTNMYFEGSDLELEILRSTRRTALKQMADFNYWLTDKYERDGDVSKLHVCIDSIVTCYYATGAPKYIDELNKISMRIDVPMSARVYALSVLKILQP